MISGQSLCLTNTQKLEIHFYNLIISENRKKIKIFDEDEEDHIWYN